jgi:3-(3-hydroxy-phenyl)propionate hydroxylase
LVNSGRLSVPCVYDGSPLNGPDCDGLPARARPGCPAPDAPQGNGWLLDRLGGGFQMLCIGCEGRTLAFDGIAVETVTAEVNDAIRERYLGSAPAAVYLIRPDQHVAARWLAFDADGVRAAVGKAVGR